MKKFLTAAVASIALMTSACQSIEKTKVDPATIATSTGEAVAVVQATAVGFTLIFHFVTITEASLNTVINKMLVGEAKMLGGNKLLLLSAGETPKSGLLFQLMGGIASFPMAGATGIAVR